jgi:hypothetical protein
MKRDAPEVKGRILQQHYLKAAPPQGVARRARRPLPEVPRVVSRLREAKGGQTRYFEHQIVREDQNEFATRLQYPRRLAKHGPGPFKMLDYLEKHNRINTCGGQFSAVGIPLSDRQAVAAADIHVLVEVVDAEYLAPGEFLDEPFKRNAFATADVDYHAVASLKRRQRDAIPVIPV